MRWTSKVLHSLAIAGLAIIAGARGTKGVHVSNVNPLIYFHGRWDTSPGTWWAGSGFKIHVNNLKTLSLTLGQHTTSPSLPIGVSVNYGPFTTVNVSSGVNSIPLGHSSSSASVIRINSPGWQNNRMNLESIILNPDAALLRYTPSELAFQFIGDSLSAGQYLLEGVDQAWPFLTGEAFKAEHVVNAQPGVTLTDILSYGNVHGMSSQFFKTEDDGYYYSSDHNYTTPWNFALDKPAATHVVIHIGANDASQNVTNPAFVEVYTNFLDRLRTIYPYQPIFIFTPWGWPSPTGVSYYYEGQYQIIVENRIAQGDKNIFLVNTTGWVTYADVFPDNQHPTVAGHQKIAGLFEDWLENWGLSRQERWPTSA